MKSFTSLFFHEKVSYYRIKKKKKNRMLRLHHYKIIDQSLDKNLLIFNVIMYHSIYAFG